LALAVAAVPAAASSDLTRAYVRARVSAMNGDHATAAELLSALPTAGSEDEELRQRTLVEAMGSGRMDIAIRTARTLKTEDLAPDARLLLVADALKRGKTDEALQQLAIKGDTGDLMFLAPIVRAWAYAERNDHEQAITALNEIPSNGLLAPFRDEEMAFVLLKLKQTGRSGPRARAKSACACCLPTAFWRRATRTGPPSCSMACPPTGRAPRQRSVTAGRSVSASTTSPKRWGKRCRRWRPTSPDASAAARRLGWCRSPAISIPPTAALPCCWPQFWTGVTARTMPCA
jgi:hypothetical protein